MVSHKLKLHSMLIQVGIIDVSAQDKSTSDVKKITIKNEKARLSQAGIDKMVANAEKFIRKLTHKTHLKDTVLEFVIHYQTNHLQPQSHKQIKTQSTKKSMMHLHWLMHIKMPEFQNLKLNKKELEFIIMSIMQKAYQKQEFQE